ncbi:MAG: hypothetical protein L0G87_11810 [Renibacterium salmoninarum]|nr:hypothetical protein [Renibacterium salmoninarum]
MKKLLSSLVVVISLMLAGGLALAPAAAAETQAAPPTTSPGEPGDGVWYPSHDESLAIIPICRGPLATLDWLNKNFSDHGRDSQKAFNTRSAQYTAWLLGSKDPYEFLALSYETVLQFPVYAINDTKFHVPATVKDILSFCASARSRT